MALLEGIYLVKYRELQKKTAVLLDRGTRMTAILTSVNYRRSPFVQGGLEIPCRVKITMANTKKCNLILDRYLDLISTLYTEPNPPLILGSILGDDLVMAEYPELATDGDGDGED